jgi:AcrR family transcriptional regulator
MPVMGTSLRKQREVRERELMLLDVGRRMLIEQGYAGLNMDRLAEATEYSKGTVYQHFSTKEDLVTALASQSMERRQELFGKALTFQGRPRERFLAVAMADELFVRLHPHHFRSEQVIKMADLEQRASAERRGALTALECRCFDDVGKVLEEAVAAGDLVLPPSLPVNEVMFILFTMVIGTHNAMLNFRPLLQQQGIAAPLASLREGVQIFLDGLGWRPLRSEWDYDATFRRLSREIFADECQRAGLG